MHRDESDGRGSEIFKIRPRERWRWRGGNEMQPVAENVGCRPAHFEKKRPYGAKMTLC
jgi:hypothetical protein